MIDLACPAYTGIPDCECSGTPQWSSGSGDKVKRLCDSGDCPVIRGGTCRREAEKKPPDRDKHKYISLISFLKAECANYYESSCLLSHCCEVLEGRRCDYFERSVMGPLDYKHRLPGYDYSKIFGQYALKTNTVAVKVKTRLCGCGNPLGYRQRLCDDCTEKNRRKSKSAYQKDFRKKHRVSA